jgi:hypothetical protein
MRRPPRSISSIVGLFVILIGEAPVHSAERSPSGPSFPLSITELKYRLKAKQEGRILFCGPHVGTMSLDPNESDPEFEWVAQQQELFQSILRHNHIEAPFSLQDKQIILQEYRLLSSIELASNGGRFRFYAPMAAERSGEESDGKEPHLPANASLVEGVIDKEGRITVLTEKPAFHTCPL